MSRKRKNIISLAAGIIIMGILAGIYIWQSSRPEAPAANEGPVSKSSQIINREEKDVTQAVFASENATITLLAHEGEEGFMWLLADDPDMLINRFNAQDMVRGLYSLFVAETLFDEVENPEEYGVSPARLTATAHYTDGSRTILYLGDMTPAKDRYYLMMEGDPALYLVNSYQGERFFYGVNDLVDRTLPEIIAENAEYILIREEGKPLIELGIFHDEEEMLEQYGLTYMSMLQPYPGKQLYYSYFQSRVMDEFAPFKLGDMVDRYPNDLSQYGLDEPAMEFIFRTPDDKLHVLFGNIFDKETEGGFKEYIYCLVNERPHVFMAEYGPVSALYGLNVFLFIDRFVFLVDIFECESVMITYPANPGRNYDIQTNHQLVRTPEGEDEERMMPMINGWLIDEQAFKIVYQNLIRITADQVIVPQKPSGSPVFTVTFSLTGNTKKEARFFTYDANFYTVSLDGDECWFVTSRQDSENFFKTIGELMAD